MWLLIIFIVALTGAVLFAASRSKKPAIVMAARKPLSRKEMGAWNNLRLLSKDKKEGTYLYRDENGELIF